MAQRIGRLLDLVATIFHERVQRDELHKLLSCNGNTRTPSPCAAQNGLWTSGTGAHPQAQNARLGLSQQQTSNTKAQKKLPVPRTKTRIRPWSGVAALRYCRVPAKHACEAGQSDAR
eukprot:4454661-Pleurochrysis_carterae.AAC.2